MYTSKIKQPIKNSYSFVEGGIQQCKFDNSLIKKWTHMRGQFECFKNSYFKIDAFKWLNPTE